MGLMSNFGMPFVYLLIGVVSSQFYEMRSSRASSKEPIVVGGQNELFDTIQSASRKKLEISKNRSSFYEAIPENLEKIKKLSAHERALELPLFYMDWVKRNPKAALLSAKTLDEHKEVIVSLVLSKWLESSPEAAAAMYKLQESELFEVNHLSPWSQRSSSSIVASKLAEIDSGSALEWAQSLGDIADKKIAISSVFREIANEDLEGAVALAESLEEGEAIAAMKAVVQNWVEVDPAAAADWINQQELHMQDEVLPAFIGSLALKDPYEATKYLDAVQGNRDLVINAILEPLVKESPAKAADWLLVSSTREEQEGFMKDVLVSWIEEDYHGVKGWTSSQKNSDSKDITVEAFIEVAGRGYEKPERLIQFAQTEINDLSRRKRAVTNILIQWSHRDRSNAVENAESLATQGLVDLSSFYFEANAQDAIR